MRADVVLYDSLANPRLLEYAPENADKIMVGKSRGRVTVPQEDIARMLVEHAAAGRTVVRLKGGDPFVFGRGGEEAEACAAAGVAFEIVPGVTAASAAPAYAGIPLTHREHASVVTIVTGQPGDARGEVKHDWQALVRSQSTLVFLMAMLKAVEIGRALVDAGMDPNTPAAAVRWGTTPQQTRITGTVATLGERIEAEGMRPPVAIVIGGVAGLSDTLSWYETLPLFGRKIVVTRARHQSRRLASLLEEQGAQILEMPVIEIGPPSDPALVESALGQLGSYNWLLLTSVNGAERFFDALRTGGHDIRELGGVSIAAIGPATAKVVTERGLHVAAQPDEYRAEGLLEALGDVDGLRLMLARAEVAREVLPDQLRARGAEVDVVPLYRTVLPARTPDDPDPRKVVADADMVTFTSSSTVTNLATLCRGDLRDLLADKAVAAIGPITADTLRAAAVEVDAMPDSYTVPDLAEAIIGYFSALR